MKPNRRYLPATIILSLAAASGSLSAQTIFDWKDDAPDGNWRTGADGARWWPGDLWNEPSFGILSFNNNHQLNMTNNVVGTYSTHGIIFGSANDSVRTLGGNTVRLYDFSGAEPFIRNESSATHIINLNLEGDGDAADPLKIEINGSGGLTFNGTINNQGSWIDVVGATTSAATVTINGIISGAGGLYKANANTTLVLTGANTYTGRTIIEGGIVSINADSRLGTAPGSPVADQLEINGGTLRITAAGQTLNANRGITIGASGATFDTSTISGTGITTTIGGVIAGSGPLTLASTGNMTASGGGDGGLGIKLNQTTNTFTGDVTITSGLVTYANNLSFGNAANKIILNGGGLLDPNTNIALSRNIEVQAGGGTFRTYGSNNATWSGTITGSGAINRTDGGTLTHSGDLSGFGGTYNVQGGTTVLTGTAATIGGNWTVGSGTLLTINSTTAQTLSGSVTGAGAFRVTSASFTASTTNAWNVGTISLNGTTSTLNIGPGADITTQYMNIGDGSGSSGRVVQTGGTVTLLSGGTGFRIGHWNNGANPGSLYTLSGGVLDATALSANSGSARLINIGWDGQGDMIVGGGPGSATLKAFGMQLDANGNGGGSGAGDMTLTMSANGLAEIGAGGVGAASTGDRIVLNGGSLRATATSTWGAVMNANTATTSTLDTNGFDITLNQNITGDGTIDLSSTAGSVIFNTTGTQTVSAALNGSTAVSKTGGGTTTLSGTGGTHSGTITVSGGRLNFAGSSASALALVSGATLGGEGTTTGAATLGGGAFLNINPLTSGGLTVGDLTLTGTNTLRFDAFPAIASGPVNILTYTGSLTGTLGTHLVLEGASSYRNSSFVDSAGVVTLDTDSRNLTWNGTSGGQWDVLNSARWNSGEADQFAWGDAVTFDDSGVATNISITGELRPSSITVTGSQDYTITGGAGNFISGTTGIAKSGSSTLLLNAPNTFSGANTITGGIIQAGDGTNNTASIGSGSVAISGGSTLLFFHNGTSPFGANNAITGAGTLAFQGTGVSTQSQYTIGGNNAGFSGTLDIRNGARVQVDNATDTGSGTIVVSNGGQLWLTGTTTLTNSVSLSGNGWTEAAGQLGAVRFGGGTLAGGVTLAGNARLTTWTGDTGTISGVISDGASTFGITKTGTGTLTLTQANTYDGGTVISFGRINIRNSASLGTGAVTIGDAGSGSNAISLYLDTNRVNFTRAITVTNNGTGTVTLGSMSSVTGTGDNNQFTSINLQRNVTFDSNAADRTDYENISGTGSITVSGAGRTIFTTNNTYVGNLTIQTSTDSNGLQLGTISTAVNALSDTGSVQIDSGGKLSLSYTNGGSETIGALTGAGNVRLNNNSGNTNTLIVGNGGGSGTFSGVLGGGTGVLAFTKVGTGTQTLSGANTYTGATAINGGTLALDYGTQNNSKLSDTAALTFGAGSATLSLVGGSHTEVVGSTTLAANTSANITRSAGTSVVQLGTITVNTNAALNLSAAGIATTNTLNNAAGMLGAWATVGNDWAQSAASGTNIPITAYTGYTDYTRLDSGTKIIADNTAHNARIIDGTGSPANLTLAAATTNINTLNQSATGGATTIAMGTNTLRLGTTGGILAGPGVSALTIGSAVNQGFLSAGGSTANTTGTLYLTNNSGNVLTINSPLINNGTGAVTLVKTGSGRVDLAGNTGATFSGGTFVNQGMLRVVAPTTSATYSTLGTGAVTVNSGATLEFFTGSTSNTITYTNAINLNNATLIGRDGNHVLSGAVTLTGSNTIDVVWADKNLTLSGAVGGSGSITKTGANSLILSGNNNFSGGITISGGRLQANLGTTAGSRTMLGSGAVTANSGTTLRLFAGSTTNAMTIANAMNLNSATLVIEDAIQTLSGAMALTGTNTVNVVYGDKSGTLSGVISGSGGLTKSTGTGALTLGNNNTYTGATIVNAGRLTLTGTNASTITVNNSATLAGRGSTSGGLTTNTGANIALNGVTPATGFAAAGAVNFAGTTSVGFDAIPTTLGTTQHLVAGYGTLSGLANLVAPSGYRSAFVNDTPNSRVLLEITSGMRTWNRTTAGNWDTLSSTSWAEGDSLFANADAVVFDDTATDGSVNLVGSLNPSAVTFNNTSTTYSLTGSGVMAGITGVSKSGSGIVTIATANTYTGATTVTDGVLVIGNNAALGSTAGGTTVAGTGQLRMDGGITVGAEALSLAGTGPGGAGALLSSAASNTYGGRVTTTGATTVAVANDSTLNLTGGFTLNNTLTKTGGGTLALTGYTGSTAGAASDFVVNEGVLQFGSGYFNNSPFGYRALVITVNPDGILRQTAAHALGGDNIDGGTSFGQIRLLGGEYNLNGSQYISAGTVSGEGRILLQGGSVTGTSDFRANGGASGAFITSLASDTTSVIGNTGGISLQYGSLTVDTANGAAATDLRITGPITSPASNTNTLTKTGAGVLELQGTNTYTGGTTVSAGTLLVNNTGGSGTGTGSVNVTAAAFLGGDGAIAGAVNLSGTLLPGQGGTTDRTLTINGNVTTNAGSAISFTVDAMNNHDQLIMGTTATIDLTNADLVVSFGNSLVFTPLAAGEGAAFLNAISSNDFSSISGTWFRLIEGSTSGMFANVTDTLTAGELAYLGLTGSQHAYNATNGERFWVAQGSTYLVAIPEPSAALLGTLGLLALLRRRRQGA